MYKAFFAFYIFLFTSCKRETYMIEFKPPDGKGRMHIRQREKREREEEKEEGSK